jgi:CBS domain-containing protein
MPLGEICNREVIFARRADSIREAARLMRDYHVGDLVVVDETDGQRRPAGMLTDRDIVVELVAKNVDLDSVTVGDAMSTAIVTAHESDGIYETIQLMRSEGVRRLPVVDRAGILIGIISLDDLLELLSDEMVALSRLASSEVARERSARPASQ